MLPNWVTFVVAAFVIAFGVFRIHLARMLARERKQGEAGQERPSFRQRGYYARSPRTHVLFGVAYLALGALCLALGFGLIELRFGSAPPAEQAPAEQTPAGAVEVETVPAD